MSCFSHFWDEFDYSVIILNLTIFIFLSYVVLLRYLGWTLITSPCQLTFIKLPFLSKWNCLCSLGIFFLLKQKTGWEE